MKLGWLGALIAFVAIAGAGTFSAHPAAAAPTATGSSKVCTGTTGTAAFSCTLTVALTAAAPAADTFTITLTGNANFNATGTTFTSGCAAAPALTVGATTISFTVGGGGCAGPIVIAEALTATGVGGGALSQTVTEAGGAPGTITIAATTTAGGAFAVPAPATTVITLTGCSIGAAFLAGALVTTATTAQTVTCRITFSDNDPTPAAVASGQVTVTVNGPSGVLVAGSGVPAGNTIAVHCPVGNAVGAELCSTVDVTFTATAATVLGQVSIHVQYAPDAATGFANTPAGADLILFTFIQPVAAFVQPITITIACGVPTAVVAIPGPIAALPGTPIQVGVLPAALLCTVTPTPAAVAPGVIEVSSINGTLITASGQLTTNLRISCGDPTVISFVPGTGIDPNTCLGVRFSVAGFGVGLVELRARYEPSSAAVAAGIEERTTSANVFFVAPNPCAGAVGCSLLLNPNPVSVGQTGTATLRFGRDILLCGVGIFCVDPTTGAFILVNNGSIINGSVVFSIADSLVASWVGAQPTAALPIPTSTAGFVTTANQATVRCGFFPTVTLPANPGFVVGQPPLSTFFGGCETASATYRGNNPGVTAVNATFIPDLPGAAGFAGVFSAIPPTSFGQASNFTSTRALEVIGLAPVGDVQLARGCNNVSPTVSEPSAAYAARVNPSGALVAIWEHQAATNTFRGWSPAAGAPNDLAAVTRLKPVFVCVSGAAVLSQPPA